MCIPLAHHKVCIKCSRCRLCRLGAHQSCLWLLEVVSRPAHGPQADVEELAASAWLPVLVVFSQRKEAPLPPPGGDSPVHRRNKDQFICTLYAHFMQTQCKHSADLLHTNSKPSTRTPARSKVVETLDHGAVTVHANRPSIAVHLVQLHLPLVFWLLDQLKRREVTSTDLSL
jgi:hypothetical protein